MPFLRTFRNALLVAFALVLMYTVLGLFGPYLTGVAIDRFIAGKDPAGLARTALLMLAAYLLSNLLQVIANWIMAGISQRALKQTRGDLFGHRGWASTEQSFPLINYSWGYYLLSLVKYLEEGKGFPHDKPGR